MNTTKHPDDNDISWGLRLSSKRSSKVEARVADELKFDLQRKCHELGMSESDYVMRLLAITLYGVEHVNSMEQARTRAVLGMSGLVPAHSQQAAPEHGLRVAA